MFQPLPFSIGLRYLRAKRRNGFISFISMASILGIIIGVIALITTISVMSGFQQELRDRILGMVAHATVSGIGGPLRDWPRAVELAGEDPRVIGAAPYIETESLLQGRSRRGAIIRGVLPSLEPQVSELADKMVQGSLDDLQAGEYRIILGRELSLLVGAGVGDSVNAFVSESVATPFGSVPRAKRSRMVGTMKPGILEYPSMATRWLVSQMAGLPKRSSTTSRYCSRLMGHGCSGVWSTGIASSVT